MLFRQDALDRIRSGRVSVVFRRWRYARVRAGSRLRNRPLAATYRRILAESEAAPGGRENRIDAAVAVFYQGFVAEAIDKYLATAEPLDCTGRRNGGPPATHHGGGVLRAGACADVAVFDAAAFGETATTFEPNRLARGMRHVVVNGVHTLRDGSLTGSRGGQVIRRAH